MKMNKESFEEHIKEYDRQLERDDTLNRIITHDVIMNCSVLVDDLVTHSLITWDDMINDTDNEIFEYWFVSEWLFNKLYEFEDVPLIDSIYGYIWGRTETGQALSMDYDLNRVVNKLFKNEI